MSEHVERRRPWGAAIATVMTFLALGPPLGGLLFSILLIVSPPFFETTVPADKGIVDLLSGGVLVMLFALPFSYILGGLQAGFCGLVLSVYGWFKGKPAFWAALAASLLSFLMSYAFNFTGTLFDSSYMLLMMLVVHVIPTLLCWLIVRTFWLERK
jgi:hypothetical protein